MCQRDRTPHPMTSPAIPLPHDLLPNDAEPVSDASSAGVVARRLANGMEVVFLPDRRSPIVTHMVWYRNGSADDPPGKSGIAHFLEHLMFKGTKTYPAGHFSKLVAAVGGQENAFTSYDYTAYYQRVPREHLATCMAYEADRMTNLVLSDEVVAVERDVVLAERGMITEADPGQRLEEAVQLAAFPAHPSGRPVIGWRHEIESLSGGDALAYYRRFYTPENAILVVSGNAETDEVLTMAEAAYGAIPAAGAAPVRERLQDPPVFAHRQITLADAEVRQPRLQTVYSVPSSRTAAPGEAEALEVLAYLLGGDTNAILYNRLVVDCRCALSIWCAYWETALERSRFFIGGLPADGVGPETLEQAIEEVLLSLRTGGFEDDAIERTKTQLVADMLYSHDSQVGLANRFGSALACGHSLADLAGWQARIEAVTPEALHTALLRLDRSGAVSGYLIEAAAAA